MEPKSFNEAYALARKNNVPVFVWKGKKYSSDIKVQANKNKTSEKSGIVSNALNIVKQGASQSVRNSRNKSIGEKIVDFAIGSPYTKVMNLFTSLPINLQQMALKIAGLPTKMNENDLNQKQKVALYGAIKQAQSRTGNKSGYIDYKDYGKGGNKIASGQAEGKLKKTLTDPSFQTATTLGRGYFKDKGDSIIYTDKYDFSKGAFENTPNPNAYQVARMLMGRLENPNPSEQDKQNMRIRIALSKKDMEKSSKQKG